MCGQVERRRPLELFAESFEAVLQRLRDESTSYRQGVENFESTELARGRQQLAAENQVGFVSGGLSLLTTRILLFSK